METHGLIVAAADNTVPAGWVAGYVIGIIIGGLQRGRARLGG